MSTEQADVVQVAYMIAESSDKQWPEIFHELRRRKLLAKTMMEIAELVKHPVHGPLAEQALDKIGFNVMA